METFCFSGRSNIPRRIPDSSIPGHRLAATTNRFRCPILALFLFNNWSDRLQNARSKDHNVCHEHQLEGPITVQCLEGWIAFTADDDKHSLKAGQWTYLPPGVRHTISGVEDSLVLLTIIFP